jgi:hypothetical protein
MKIKLKHIAFQPFDFILPTRMIKFGAEPEEVTMAEAGILLKQRPDILELVSEVPVQSEQPSVKVEPAVEVTEPETTKVEVTTPKTSTK